MTTIPTATSAIDAFVFGLDYDPKVLLSVRQEGDTESTPVKRRSASDDSVVITTTTEHTLTKNLSDVAVLRPTAGSVFPGALVLADRNLMDGQPTPVGLPRAGIRISIDLPGLETSYGEVPNPSNSAVQDAVNSLLEKWNADASGRGYVNAARSYLERTTAFSSQQAALDLNINATWARGSADTQLAVRNDSTSATAMAFYKQVFYTVTVDTPPTPSAFFASSVSVDDLRRVVGNDHPLAYVRSVDYGRLVMVKMTTTENKTGVDLKAALQFATAGASAQSDMKGKYEGVLKNSHFQVLALGGGAATSAEFTGAEEDLARLADYIKKDATFRRDNPGAPVSYNVAFMKDNTLATMGFTTSYTEKESVEYPNGWVGLWHNGAYVAKFEASWVENDENGNIRTKSWNSGNQTAGYTHKLALPGDATKVHLVGQVATGLVWSPWQPALDVTERGVTNKWYRIYGTTLNRKTDNSQP